MMSMKKQPLQTAVRLLDLNVFFQRTWTSSVLASGAMLLAESSARLFIMYMLLVEQSETFTMSHSSRRKCLNSIYTSGVHYYEQ